MMIAVKERTQGDRHPQGAGGDALVGHEPGAPGGGARHRAWRATSGLVAGVALLELMARGITGSDFFRNPDGGPRRGAVGDGAASRRRRGRRLLPGAPGGGDPPGRGAAGRVGGARWHDPIFDLDHWQEIKAALLQQPLCGPRSPPSASSGGSSCSWSCSAPGTGLRHGVMRGFQGSATNSFFLWTQRTQKPWAGMPAGRAIELTNADVAGDPRQGPRGGGGGAAQPARRLPRRQQRHPRPQGRRLQRHGRLPGDPADPVLPDRERAVPEPARHRRDAQGRGHRHRRPRRALRARTRTRSANRS